MKNLQKNERILIFAAGIILLSILLMIIVIPGVYTGSIQNRNNPGAVFLISLAILVRSLIFIGYILIIRKNRRDGKKRKAGYIVIGILLIIFGLIYSTGAFAYSNSENILYVSFLMFTSVLCDLIASILIFIAISLKSQKVN